MQAREFEAVGSRAGFYKLGYLYYTAGKSCRAPFLLHEYNTGRGGGVVALIVVVLLLLVFFRPRRRYALLVPAPTLHGSDPDV